MPDGVYNCSVRVWFAAAPGAEPDELARQPHLAKGMRWDENSWKAMRPSRAAR